MITKTKTFFALIIIGLFSCGATAQNLKFAHVDSQKLLEIYPGRDSAEKVLQKEYNDMQVILEEMQVEFNKKYQSYLEKQDSLSSIAKKTKEEELQELQMRVQNFQSTAQEGLQQKEAELFKPIMDSAKALVEEVAKEGGYIYVFDVSGGQLLYQSEKSIDLLPVLKKKLGIE